MKFKKKTREHVNDIGKFIESLGGVKTSEAESGSIYYHLPPIKKIRIADHLSNKGHTEYLQIIIQKEKRYHKYICVFCRNILIFGNVGLVKQWISNIYFIFTVISINGHKLFGMEDTKYEAIKKDVELKDAKLSLNKKEIENLTNAIERKDKQIESLKDQIKNLSKYHNMWQEAESKANSLHKSVEKLLKQKHNENFGPEEIIS